MTESKFILSAGEIVGEHYRVLGFLGSGAMGAVFRVHHDLLSQDYALKILTREDPELWQRFQNEAQAIARLSHPNLIAVYNFGLHKGLPYYVMDLLDGIDLAQRIKKTCPLTPEEALPIFIEVCGGIGYAHKKGVVHRDIKPSNILLIKQAAGVKVRAKVLDFGIAKLLDKTAGQDLTKTGQVFGTPYYMSPEQCQGKSVDSRSDIYSLGCTLFETLTGRVPVAGANALETMLGHVAGDTLKLNYDGSGKFSAELELLVARTLAREPEHRYQTMEHLARDLNAVLGARKISVKPQASGGKSGVGATDTSSAKSAKQYWRTPLVRPKFSILVSVAVLSVVSLSGAFVFMHYSHDRSTSVSGAKSRSVAVQNEGQNFGSSYSTSSISNSGRRAQQTSSQITPGVQIASASLSLHTPFSQMGSEFGRSLRHFDFPDDTCIGTLRAVGRTSEDPYPAQGIRDFPEEQALEFCPAPVVTKVYKFNCLTRFQRGDVYSLKIENCPESERLLALGSEIPGIKELNLFGVDSLSSAVGAVLPRFRELEVVDASYTNLSGSTLSNIADQSWKTIRKFYFARAKSPGPVLEKLAGSKNLTNLGLKETILSPRDIALVAKCSQLTALDLDGSSVTSADLLVLSQLPISELCLRHTRLTESAADSLLHFKDLRHVYLSNEPAEAPLYESLQRTLKGVTMHRDGLN